MQSYSPKKESKTELSAVLTGEKIDRTSGATEEKRASQQDESESEDSTPSGTPYERSFFHGLLLLVRAFMLLMWHVPFIVMML